MRSFNLALLALALVAIASVQGKPMDVEVEQDEDDETALERMETGFSAVVAKWKEIKDEYDGKIDELLEEGKSKAEKKFEEFKAETVETVKQKVKDWDSKVTTQELKTFFVDANKFLDKELPVDKIKGYMAALPEFVDILGKEIAAQKEPLMKMLEKVQKLWEQNKGKLISEDGKEARELIMARIEMARVALGEVYNKYNLDIELVVEQSKILLKRIGVKINSLNTDILVGAMQAWAKAVKQVEDGPAADIIAQFKKFTDSVEAEVKAMQKEGKIKSAFKSQDLFTVMMAFQKEPYVPLMKPLFAELMKFYGVIQGKAMEVGQLLKAAESA